MNEETITPDQQQLAAIKVRVAERLSGLRNGFSLIDPGFVSPPDPSDRESEICRREMQAAINELEILAGILGLE